MKIFFLYLSLLFLPFGCSFALEAPPVTRQEPVDAKIWDFGRIERGKVLKHTFILKNKTAKTLKIKDVTTSCGCTVSQVKSKVLFPQESTSIDVQFNSSGYSGTVQQYVYVSTDNPDTPILKFTIKADVVK